MSRKKRLGLCALFLTGLFVTICSIIRTVMYIQNYASWNGTSKKKPTGTPIHLLCRERRTNGLALLKEDFVWHILWTLVELNLAIICACVPSLWSMTARLRGRLRSIIVNSSARSKSSAGKPFAARKNKDQDDPNHPFSKCSEGSGSTDPAMPSPSNDTSSGGGSGGKPSPLARLAKARLKRGSWFGFSDIMNSHPTGAPVPTGMSDTSRVVPLLMAEVEKPKKEPGSWFRWTDISNTQASDSQIDTTRTDHSSYGDGSVDTAERGFVRTQILPAPSLALAPSAGSVVASEADVESLSEHYSEDWARTWLGRQARPGTPRPQNHLQ